MSQISYGTTYTKVIHFLKTNSNLTWHHIIIIFLATLIIVSFHVSPLPPNRTLWYALNFIFPSHLFMFPSPSFVY